VITFGEQGVRLFFTRGACLVIDKEGKEEKEDDPPRL